MMHLNVEIETHIVKMKISLKDHNRNRLLDSGRVLASSAGGPGSIPSQWRRHTKDV